MHLAQTVVVGDAPLVMEIMFQGHIEPPTWEGTGGGCLDYTGSGLTTGNGYTFGTYVDSGGQVRYWCPYWEDPAVPECTSEQYEDPNAVCKWWPCSVCDYCKLSVTGFPDAYKWGAYETETALASYTLAAGGSYVVQIYCFADPCTPAGGPLTAGAFRLAFSSAA